ncbi:hypothetical protein RhiirA5_468274 [Rhizophagus irregularis]|uniref:Homeodomain-like protein n=3 Tax=Rhizophagus irregularis TaxID=588596 RepID=A0A2I1DVH8_9GLOM|nr:Homeodomain-like protein [Rhizophagus irregularis DAOM 181602=DAOM 197198]EXX57090.1 Cef1p [Rhizophagus irregularis DAOM 197198w]PKB97425.1 hypothetical protein RhiirA5_468274 [Rhizophagus irregularis]PKC62825.1 hypothetical protein RhiirA1_538212 [Rhizophagus irregularis]PKK72556.1 hypothetical protein RhiirC2_377577 [Rhizophagus irregularis]PKY13876.1 hypothetical protein RhiirB3_499480 [Rhizophagus irregularis]|eukprot:XP_025186622.1 Homeodomain-like protein [Rhizophagus irregularis DAOM 181602=DAOM 197198]
MSDNLTIIKGPWNNLEDEKIRREVERYKTHYPNQQISWKFIEEAIQNRTAKQCRERWTNHLNNVNKAPLTVEEERLILQLREDDPNISYVQISEKLPGRTPLIIKNFIYRERIKAKKSIIRIRQLMSINYINH